MKALLPSLAIVFGVSGVLAGQGPLSMVFIGLCVVLALIVVGQYVAGLSGHDPWRKIRREHRRRRARR